MRNTKFLGACQSYIGITMSFMDGTAGAANLLELTLQDSVGPELVFTVNEFDIELPATESGSMSENFAVVYRGDVLQDQDGVSAAVEISIFHLRSEMYTSSLFSMDPTFEVSRDAFQRLVNQSHWHVLVLDRKSRVVAVLEASIDQAFKGKIEALPRALHIPADLTGHMMRLWANISSKAPMFQERLT